MESSQKPAPHGSSEAKSTSQKATSQKAADSSQTTELTKPPRSYKNVLFLSLLAVGTILCVVAMVVVVTELSRENDAGEGAGEKVVIRYAPSPSKLGNYSQWAAATDAKVCAGASRWIYEQGGNAIDAAVATLLCHSLALPESNGIGGGFVATIYWAKNKTVHTLFARETAPALATKNMFVGKEGASLRAGASPNSAAQKGSSSSQQDGPYKAPAKPEAGLPQEGEERRYEKAEASSVGNTISSGAVKTPSEPEPMTGIESDSARETGKRPQDAKNKAEPNAATADEPPAKTTPLRRSLLRPRPNISTERKTAETPPLPP
ncbi:hypothetical protein MTO96_026054 [Rhipicephalus appendiculatus]